MEQVRFTLRLPRALAEELDRRAQERGISRTALIRIIIYDYITRGERK